jgi:hypothetical protein
MECAGRTKWRRRFGHGTTRVDHPARIASAKALSRVEDGERAAEFNLQPDLAAASRLLREFAAL